MYLCLVSQETFNIIDPARICCNHRFNGLCLNQSTMTALSRALKILFHELLGFSGVDMCHICFSATMDMIFIFVPPLLLGLVRFSPFLLCTYYKKMLGLYIFSICNVASHCLCYSVRKCDACNNTIITISNLITLAGHEQGTSSFILPVVLSPNYCPFVYT